MSVPLKHIENCFEEYDLLQCDCEPIWETNVIECNCGDYLSEFEVISRDIAEESISSQAKANAEKQANARMVEVLDDILKKIMDKKEEYREERAYDEMDVLKFHTIPLLEEAIASIQKKIQEWESWEDKCVREKIERIKNC